ncbi:adhesion G-protein coupled receptor G5-like isoform X2 [Gadus macrocephalus]|uniref:adhesion G-protein coupled receptor G5-like isoform X2 n=1 Tax=Gadus macrocephalus TaxID=80720 RepID=UPI0028CB7A34|nr:adhesion G-protein coupled receptor G5-like isoform X2 [Gadus macrocephalus]
METRMMDRSLLTLLLLLVGCSIGSCTDDKNFKFCGSWRHGNNNHTLNYDLSPGCKNFAVSANDSTLSVVGQITSQCTKSGSKSLKIDSVALWTKFCVHWEPLKDHLWLELPEQKLHGQKVTLCEPSCTQTCLCPDLSPEAGNRPDGVYGIANGSIRGDRLKDKVLTAYVFLGDPINCTGEEPCDNASHRSNQVNITKGIEMGSHVVGNVDLPKTNATVVEMKENFQGFDFKAPAPYGADLETLPSIHLPASLKPAPGKTAKLVCTFFRNKTLFQEPKRDVKILEDVVGITVENEVITNLSERIRIGFHHDALPKTHSRKCVSWDTKTDPQKVNWKEDGCVTEYMGAKKTECHCNHLTYFTIMVRLERRTVPHLLALTVITSLGNAVSTISCVALIIFLCNKRRVKEQSSPVHLGLAVSLFLLNLLFFFTGTLANVGGEGLCRWVGPGLHYALLSSFTWMAMEVFYTFWMVYMVFSPSPRAFFWYLIGFALPALPVLILVAIGNIYGIMEVVPSDDPSNPYLMCWMRNTPQALLAHYLINISMLVGLVSSGLLMLFLVYWKIRTRNEWRHKKVAFLSIWGLSCLFGTTWGLGFLDFGPLSTFVLFLSCILNSFQGFFLMLRFYVLGWMKRREEGDSTLGSSSLTGSARQQMLQVQEKQ